MIYIYYIILLLCSKIKKQLTLFYYVTSPPSMPSNKGNKEPSGAHCLDRESGCCGVKALVPNEHQNSWHSWMFVGPKMVPSALTQPIWFDQQLNGMMIILDVIINIMEHYYHISIMINDPARTLFYPETAVAGSRSNIETSPRMDHHGAEVFPRGVGRIESRSHGNPLIYTYSRAATQTSKNAEWWQLGSYCTY